MKLYVTFRANDDGLYYVARLTGKAETVAGPFRDATVAHDQAERLAGPTAVRSTWPAEFQVSANEYAAELHVDALPRECYIVRTLNDDNRSYMLRVRLTESERADLQARADQETAGDISKLVRRQLFDA